MSAHDASQNDALRFLASLEHGARVAQHARRRDILAGFRERIDDAHATLLSLESGSHIPAQFRLLDECRAVVTALADLSPEEVRTHTALLQSLIEASGRLEDVSSGGQSEEFNLIATLCTVLETWAKQEQFARALPTSIVSGVYEGRISDIRYDPIRHCCIVEHDCGTQVGKVCHRASDVLTQLGTLPRIGQRLVALCDDNQTIRFLRSLKDARTRAAVGIPG